MASTGSLPVLLYEIARGSGASLEYFFADLAPHATRPPHCLDMLLDLMRSLGEIKDEKYLGAIGRLVRSLAAERSKPTGVVCSS